MLNSIEIAEHVVNSAEEQILFLPPVSLFAGKGITLEFKVKVEP